MRFWKNSVIMLIFLTNCQENISTKPLEKALTSASPLFLYRSKEVSSQALLHYHKIQTPLKLSKDFLMGKFDPKQHSHFVAVAMEYSVLGIPLYMQKEAYRAFLKMRKAAAKDGVSLNIVSSFRSFYEQKYIWDIKWKKNEDTLNVEKAKFILRYSAMPGTSRHHWGTDIDLNSVEPDYFERGEGKRVYAWLQKNASKFGFFQPYTPIGKNRPTGYFEEKWHWSYRPIAEKCLKTYQQTISFQDFHGFTGAELARKLNIIEEYVLAITP